MTPHFENAESYDRFMGRFSAPLAKRFVEAIAPTDGDLALDVGCGPGALTKELIDALGAGQVSAVDPSEPFVSAARSRFPGADIQIARAESLPYPDDTFDLTLSQLVIHFIADPVVAIREMARVTRRGGRIAANVWDFKGSRGPLGVFQQAALDLDPAASVSEITRGTGEGDMLEMVTRAGLTDVTTGELTVDITFPTFAEWWDPFTLGIGPAGAYVVALEPDRRAELERHARTLLPAIPFTIDATAWTVIGRTPR
ncbi:SAM-dependent methyltransferase [Subtercola boreus]|uniref:SAM-dependent methyltransferase n=1 Tax=Subtercola boreus TaxID=120213 RepID=A0A3E0VMT3_9MICO|nr:class I SAM-dependent methyltransferase [Subtercola boreus]RFA10768.1 SAM-dependent methyltransferase [Subtercola boreus]TQL55659.1 methyltransferase family protein [Subtercola boreus]